MKKKNMNLWLLAALVCGLSLSVTSCKDDDKDDNDNDPELVTSDTDTDEAKAAYNWLANMTDIEDFTDDWAKKTYEPTIGIESKNESNTRIVVVADIDYAKMNFASISGLSISQLSAAQSQTIKGVGTITWTPSAAGASNLATVDVNTKLIPHLSKIVYCTVDQVGDNGGYAGTAYYRFGDVIEDTEGFYWVCVKPAFGTGSAPQQQGYWINILNRDAMNGKSKNGTDKVPEIPAKNIYNKSDKKYNGNTILLPTSLGSTKEQVHNLSNLVWALLEPDRYLSATGKDAIGLGGYDYKYNGAKFCQRVAEQWTQKGIWEKLFNRSYEQMKQFQKLNFFYNGYHWIAGSTAGVWIANSTGYASTFTGSKSDDDILFEMKEKGAGFDIRRYCSDPQQDAECASSGKAGYAPKQQFTSTEGYWVVRQKTSSQIAGTMLHPSVYAALNNTAEIYRYNQVYSNVVGSESPVEEENTMAEVYISNAPAKGEGGTYMLGDVVTDPDYGSARWFCITGSPYRKGMTDSVTDHTAWFVSLDADGGLSQEALNLVSEDELPELACRFMSFLSFIESGKEDYQMVLKQGKLGKIGQHILDYAGVDLRKLVTVVDSTWTFTNYNEKKQYESESNPLVFNIAYKSATDHNGSNPHIARCVIDYTQAGSHRSACYTKSGKCLADLRFLCYKNYETYDPERVTITDDEESVGMTKWQALWPTTDDQMRLKDVTDQAMIDKYAKGDKWQKSPRTTAETSVVTDDYYWKNGAFATKKTSIFKEPVLFLRVMKVTDEGGPIPQLVSEKKTRLKVVHMQNDAYLYRSNYQTTWAVPYSSDSQTLFFLNNKLFPVKQIPGFKK